MTDPEQGCLGLYCKIQVGIKCFPVDLKLECKQLTQQNKDQCHGPVSVKSKV